MHDLLTDLEFVELEYKKNQKKTRGCLEVKLIAHNAGDSINSVEESYY